MIVALYFLLSSDTFVGSTVATCSSCILLSPHTYVVLIVRDLSLTPVMPNKSLHYKLASFSVLTYKANVSLHHSMLTMSPDHLSTQRKMEKQFGNGRLLPTIRLIMIKIIMISRHAQSQHLATQFD